MKNSLANFNLNINTISGIINQTPNLYLNIISNPIMTPNVNSYWNMINTISGDLTISGTVNNYYMIDNLTGYSVGNNSLKLTLNGGISVKKTMHIGNKLNIYSTLGNISLYSQNSSGDLIISNPRNNYILASNTTSGPSSTSLTLFGLNNTKGNNYEVFEILCNSTSSNGIYNIHTESNGTGILKPLQINVGNNIDLFMHTNGNIGINTTNPSYQLDINGTVQANNYNYFNQLSVYNTSPATSSVSSGSLTVAGGTSISKNLFVGGQATFTNTLNSSSTSAAVLINGGLTVATSQSGTIGSGALTVNGGGYFNGELYIQQNLIVQGKINSASSSIFPYLTLTATDESLNLSSGSFLTSGGITIKFFTEEENSNDLDPSIVNLTISLVNYSANPSYTIATNVFNFTDI
jgi:hypothetical protein